MPANFDSVARWYGLLEALAFGAALQRCRVALVDEVNTARRVLIAGEGNGRFLEALLKVNRAAEVTVIDSSARMLELARARVGPTSRVRFIHGNLLDPAIPLPPSDLVVTDFFLDCFNEAELDQVIERLRESLSVGGRWLWSDFAIPASGPMRVLAKAIIGLLYGFFRLVSGISARRLIDPGPHFGRAQLALLKSRVLNSGLLTSAIYRVNGPAEVP